MQDPHITDDELQQYIDGVLPEPRLDAMLTWLASHPAEREQVRQLRELNTALHGQFDAALTEPAPARLTRELTRKPFDRRALLAASMVSLVVGALVGWGGHAWTAKDGGTQGAALSRARVAGSAWPHQAVLAHIAFTPEVRHPVEVGANDEAHLVAWLSKRLGMPLKPASLTASGYDLMGGRLLPGEDGPLAQFMYQHRNGKRLTLVVARKQASTDTAFKYLDERGVGVFYWIDGPFGYALSGELPRKELLAIATGVYKQLNP